MNRIPRTAHLVVCDDIRQEANNKHSLMGIYGPDVLVEKLPALLPKLCLQVHVRTPTSRPIKTLKVELTGPGSDRVEVESPANILQQAATEIRPDSEFLIYTFNLISAPFIINEAGLVRVTAVADEKKLLAGQFRTGLMNQTTLRPEKSKRQHARKRGE